MKTIEEKLDKLIKVYNKLVKGIEGEALASKDRAYGGIIRAGKGKMLENITAELVRIAWTDVLKQEESRLKIDKKKMPIGIKDGYIERISHPKVKERVQKERDEHVYNFGTDVQVRIDDKLVLPIECKAFTENAMLKRILFDAELMKEAVGTETYYLIQLESQLGGDYSELKDITYGSHATHALLSHVDVNLVIITLLKGERMVDSPIHKKHKNLKKKQLKKALKIFADALRAYVK